MLKMPSTMAKYNLKNDDVIVRNPALLKHTRFSIHSIVINGEIFFGYTEILREATNEFSVLAWLCGRYGTFNLACLKNILSSKVMSCLLHL